MFWTSALNRRPRRHIIYGLFDYRQTIGIRKPMIGTLNKRQPDICTLGMIQQSVGDGRINVCIPGAL